MLAAAVIEAMASLAPELLAKHALHLQAAMQVGTLMRAIPRRDLHRLCAAQGGMGARG